MRERTPCSAFREVLIRLRAIGRRGTISPYAVGMTLEVLTGQSSFSDLPSKSLLFPVAFHQESFLRLAFSFTRLISFFTGSSLSVFRVWPQVGQRLPILEDTTRSGSFGYHKRDLSRVV